MRMYVRPRYAAAKACRRLLRWSAILVLLTGSAVGGDWPMWRHDAVRSGATDEELPPKLHLQWVRQLPPPEPAWDFSADPRLAGFDLKFDATYEPVAGGDSVYVPSMVNDTVTAYSAATGAEKWRFYADGPVRFAPILHQGRVYFAADDGYMYCLDAANGTRQWRFRAAPSDRKIIGNGRLVSTWPARGGPVLADGRLYLAAGIWPFMGTFIHAVDPATGAAVWANDNSNARWLGTPTQHNDQSFSGTTAQGYLVAAGDSLAVPCGLEGRPFLFRRRDGELVKMLAGKGTGCFLVGTGNHYVNQALTDAATGESSGRFDVGRARVVTDGGTVYIVNRDRGNDKLYARELQGGKLWEVEVPREHRPFDLWLKAGKRLYGGHPGLVLAVEPPASADERVAKVAWAAAIDGTPGAMLAANGKLFVVTLEGRLYCFGARERQAATHAMAPRETPAPPDWTKTAAGILRQTSIRQGYCLVLGLKDGGLVAEMLGRTDLNVIAVDPDAAKIDRLRRELDAAGLYGERATALVGDPASFEFPPYLASLVVSEDLAAAGYARPAQFVGNVFRALRPFGGVACLPTRWLQHKRLVRAVAEAGIEGAEVRRGGGFALIARPGPPAGSADWSHEWADAGNTFTSKDTLRPPLGVLYFGTEWDNLLFDRHCHPPEPLVVGGRMFLQGPHPVEKRLWGKTHTAAMLYAADVYTGRLLWGAPLPRRRSLYMNRSPGVQLQASGVNYAAVDDGVYVASDDVCIRFDPATGKEMSRFTIPPATKGGPAPYWIYLAVQGDDLIAAAATPADCWDAESNFTPPPLDATSSPAQLARLAGWVLWLEQSRMIPRRRKRSNDADAGAYALARAQELTDPSSKVAKTAGDKVKALRAMVQATMADPEAYDRDRRRQKLQAPSYRPVSLWTAERIVAMNRHTGKVRWTHEVDHAVRPTAIAAGNGLVYYIDMALPELAALRAKVGKTPAAEPSLKALDQRTGKVVWSTREGEVWGDRLAYSAAHDLLVQTHARVRMYTKFRTYEGRTGKLLARHFGRPYPRAPGLLHGDSLVYLTGDRLTSSIVAFDGRTGKVKKRLHHMTGAPVSWGGRKEYGCNAMIASENLITLRSARAGYYDLATHGGQGNWSGFRSGCTNGLLVANGVLSAPNLAQGCRCVFQNYTSLALAPMPEVETWTCYYEPSWERGSGRTIRVSGTLLRLGLNLGAPGDRAHNGTLWLDYPSVGGPGPVVELSVTPVPRYYRVHSSRLESGDLRWVAASGCEGLRELSVRLAEHTRNTHRYAVKLVFAEPSATKPGERVFDVKLQGRTVLRDFDIFAVAGGRWRTVVREFDNIEAAGRLVVEFEAKAGVPLLCGVEAVAAGPDDLAAGVQALATRVGRRASRAVRAAQAVKLDGVLDDPVWQRAPAQSGFVAWEAHGWRLLLAPTGQPVAAAEQTTFRFAYDQDAVYFAARLETPGGPLRDAPQAFPANASARPVKVPTKVPWAKANEYQKSYYTAEPSTVAFDPGLWRDSPAAAPLTDKMGTPSKWATMARFAYDQANLYVMARCEEPQMAALTSQPQRPDKPWRCDSIEMFVDPTGKAFAGRFYQFCVTSSGSIFCQTFRKPTEAPWSGRFSGGVTKEETAWTAFMAIPWKTLGVDPPAHAEYINLGLVRNRLIEPVERSQLKGKYVVFRADKGVLRYASAADEIDSGRARDGTHLRLWLAPMGAGERFYKFLADPMGGRWDAAYSVSPPASGWSENDWRQQPASLIDEVGWNCAWLTAVAVDEKGWTLEAAIPATAFGAPPQSGSVWRFNVGRNAPLSLYSFAWSMLGMETPRDFGELKFE